MGSKCFERLRIVLCKWEDETDEECENDALRRPNNRVRYAIMKGKNVHLVKNDKVRIRAQCLKTCPWVFLTSKDGHKDTVLVKTYIPYHKCHQVILWQTSNFWQNCLKKG
ncbi:conserved hypothetical protein [Ricinus communis]|uniref:Transposase MuDR plant domain-containing protein n=1 Tax=Ricinus communis TaxID=3988 RepID=B9SEJ6_RICCO|nr:conserved hypothetical protein [Ricinus communis]